MIEQTMDDTGHYQVVVNDEEQYSVWLLALPQALGWYACTPPFVGSRAACLEHIQRIWHDIRPKSMRREGA